MKNISINQWNISFCNDSYCNDVHNVRSCGNILPIFFSYIITYIKEKKTSRILPQLLTVVSFGESLFTNYVT